MSAEIKTIGILTSGGDAPGMNAAFRASARTAIYKGMRVLGIRRGYAGLLENDLFEMNIRSVSEILHRGGTVLYTARSHRFNSEEGVRLAADNCVRNGIDGLICIGGDGTFRGARDLSRSGIACIGVPGTIDNDLACSDYTIGYDTALNTAVEMIDKLRDTIQSHTRCSVVEVMGHKVGFLAQAIGIACGALVTLVPEMDYDLDRDVVDRILYTQRAGKSHFIIVMAEGCGSSSDVADFIQARTGIETRVTVLGHVQRGGIPTARDRIMATEMGARAVELLEKGKSSRVVVSMHGEVTDLDMEEALSMEKKLDLSKFEMMKMISL